MNSTKKPFVHLFETPYGKYFFDVNTDKIYTTKGNIYNALKNIMDNKDHLIDKNSKKEIMEMKKNGLLKNNRPKTMKHPESDYMDYYLKHRIPSITLQLTQNCNFRCKYCIYGQDTGLNRNHSKNRMSIDTAKAGVDFLWSHSRDAERVNIGFYGGEPLLEFDLLKNVVQYAEEIFKGKTLSFSLTTNCSLVNDEIIDYLNEHSIQILISLDGPKEVHDSQRIFAVNGCGTFDMIMEKLEFIKSKYPEYYLNKIMFNTVIDPSKKFDCINQMYLSNSLLKDLQSISSLIDDTYSKEKNKYSETFLEQRKYEDFKIFMHELGRITSKSLSSISLQNAAMESEFKDTIGRYGIYEEMSHGGPCRIGMRTFSDVEGNLFPCERVSESSKVMHIGHIRTGFDYKKIDQLMNVAKLTKEQCKECWAINRCFMCAKYADDGDSLCADKKLQNCMDSKMNFLYKLRRYVALKEIKAGGAV